MRDHGGSWLGPVDIGGGLCHFRGGLLNRDRPLRTLDKN